MDFTQPPLNLTIVALIAPAVIFLIKKWIDSEPEPAKKLPPGPKTLPIIGNLHLLRSPPFRSFADLAKQHGPIMHLKLGETSAIVVSSPEVAKQILKDSHPNYADKPQGVALQIMWYDYVDVAFCPYGEYWRQMRKICIVDLLSLKNVRAFGSIRKDEVAHLVESIHLSNGRPVNLTEMVFAMSSSITCRAAFGKVCKDKDALIKLAMEALKMAAGFEVADLFPSSKIVKALSRSKARLMRMRLKLDVILDDIINEHKKNLDDMKKENGEDWGKRGNGEFGTEDLVDVFLRIKEAGELDFPIGNDNIKSVLFDVFAGGTETSSTTIDWTMVELLRNPRVMSKVQAEVREAIKGRTTIEEDDIEKLKYLKLVIKESLRLHPPVPVIPRLSREEGVISGYTIPAKVKVIVNNWAMQRDPNFWEDPESFVPERFQNQSVDFTGGHFHYLPFGAGKRMCPGMTFGVASVELPLAQLLYSFDWNLPHGVEARCLDMVENLGLTAARKDSLFVLATPYQPLA